jgi:hypothetical protein
MMVIYRVGDLVYDDDLGIGIVTRIMQDDNEFDGLVYLVWWAQLGQTSIEFSVELTPYWMSTIGEKQ